MTPPDGVALLVFVGELVSAAQVTQATQPENGTPTASARIPRIDQPARPDEFAGGAGGP